MKQPAAPPAETLTFPASRIGTLDVNRIGHGLPRVKALLEIDVTDGLAAIRQAKEEGRDLSFTAWVIYHISRALSEYPRMHAFLKNKRQLAVFHDVDISTLVEREREGHKVPLVFVLRQAQLKSADQITAEIRKAQQMPADSGTAVISRGGFSRAATRLFWSLPGFLRRFLFRRWLSRPLAAQAQMGSVIVTSVGMFGDVPGWFMMDTIHPLAFGIGAVTRKPGLTGERIEPRDFLHLTVLMDHDVVDGGYMARFVADLCGRLKEGRLG